jgi:AraC-like DNA-binding protein
MKSTIPSDNEIATLETKLAEMRKAKEEARKAALMQLRASIDAIPDIIPPQEALPLIKLLERRVLAGRKNPRGTRVPEETKQKLIDALRTERHSLSDLEKMFNLSISYIARIKKEAGLTKPRQHVPQAAS